jgi:coatomer subunit beta'
MLKHSPNGRFAVVCGDGEYIIYTSLSWRNKAFGQGLEFVWASDSNEYAIRESTSKIKLFRSFKEKNVLVRPNFAAEGIFGGPLLGVKSASFLMFYDWETGVVVRRIDVVCVNVYWSDNDTVTIATPDSFYVLKFHRSVFQSHIENGVDAGEEGYEDAFEFVCEVPEVISTGVWVGDCFVYTNAANRLNFVVGDQTSTISHFDYAVYVLGFIGRDSRVYVCDKHFNIMSFGLPLSLIDYQNAVLRGDVQKAQELLPTVPLDQRNKVAKFLETQGYKDQALEITTDEEQRFELAMQLNKLDVAYQVAVKLDHEEKWKQLGDVALQMWNYGMALECWKKAGDMESCLLMYQTSGNAEGLRELIDIAMRKGDANIAFTCAYLIKDVKKCIDLLVETNRIPEAAFFARTYCPSETQRVVGLWKNVLRKKSVKLADGIADPDTYTNLFPDHEASLKLEEIIRNVGLLPAHGYSKVAKAMDMDLLQSKNR